MVIVVICGYQAVIAWLSVDSAWLSWLSVVISRQHMVISGYQQIVHGYQWLSVDSAWLSVVIVQLSVVLHSYQQIVHGCQWLSVDRAWLSVVISRQCMVISGYRVFISDFCMVISTFGWSCVCRMFLLTVCMIIIHMQLHNENHTKVSSSLQVNCRINPTLPDECLVELVV